MAPSPSPEALDPVDGALIVDLAEASIRAGLRGQDALIPDLDELTEALRTPGGVFVTVTVDGELNGCIGTIEAHEPLGQATARLAWSAAFADPRLPPLDHDGYGRAAIEVSVLTPLRPLEVATRDELLGALRPAIDGLVIESGRHRAVYLPSVWEQLPEPDAFVDQLFRKAGLRPRSWPVGLTAWVFQVQRFGRSAQPFDAPSGARQPGLPPEE